MPSLKGYVGQLFLTAAGVISWNARPYWLSGTLPSSW
jgi:hypothetical protein